MFDTYVAFHARVRPRAPAVITPSQTVPYAQFDDDVNRFAAAFRALGVGPETGVVSFETRRVYRHHVALMALIRLGVAAGVATDPLCDLMLSDQPGESNGRIKRLPPEWFDAVERADPVEIVSAPRDPDALSRVLLSSGTTKTPRRVPTSWRQRLERTTSAIVTDGRGKVGVWAMQPGIDSGLGYSHALVGWTIGAAVAAGFNAVDLIGLMERNPEGLLGVTPSQLQAVMAALPPGFEPKPGWRIIMTGAALSPRLARTALAQLSPDILVSYGATETGRIALGPATLLDSEPGAVGWPGPGMDFEVLNDAGEPAADGEQGVIRVRNSRVVTHYLNNDTASDATFQNGWVYPGDLGRRLADGSFVVDGRADERLNVENVKIMPDLLEHALLEHPDVRDAAAYAVPGRDGLDQCWIAVVADVEVSHDAMMARLKAARMRLPTIHFSKSPEIPRNARGKIDRQALRALTLAALQKGGNPA